MIPRSLCFFGMLGAAAIFTLFSVPTFCFAREEVDGGEEIARAIEDAEPERPAEGRSIGHRILWWLPNRLADAADMVRLRARLGPGVAVSARATRAVNGYLGAYGAVYVGLPGPRRARGAPSPVGVESLNGAEVSMLSLTFDGGASPEYSSTEFGAGVQAGIIGLDVGLDPLEIVDFIAGIFFMDIIDDDS